MSTHTKNTHNYHKKTFIMAVVLTALILILPLFILASQKTQSNQNLASTTNPDLDTIVKDTITSINQYGFDPANKWYRINWYINSPSQYQNTGHDGQNDLRMYEAMVWYEARHPGDTTFKNQIAAVLPTIQKEWGNTTSAKGWIYFLLLRLATYSGDPTYWNNTAKNWATKIYQGVTSTGTVIVPHGPIQDNTGANAPICPDGYRVDQNIENGLALVDAAKRFNVPIWGQAGAKEVTLIESQALNMQSHLFYRIICQGTVWDASARDGETGQIAEAFLDTGTYTSNQTYITVAQQMLDAVNNPTTGFIDNINGGLWFQKNLQTGVVDNAKKVTQQFHILIAFHKANKIMNNKYASVEQNMTQMLGGKSWVPMPVAGWLYERNPDWSFYKGTENWISTEASGIAMEAAQLLLQDQTIPHQSATPTAATPSFVCAGSQNGICSTPTPTPTTKLPIGTINPTTIAPTEITIPSNTPAPTTGKSTPSIGGKNTNIVLQLIAIVIALLETLLKAFKN